MKKLLMILGLCIFALVAMGADLQKGQTFTVAIMAEMVNVHSADLQIQYNSKLAVDSVEVGNVFTFEVKNHDPATRTITGYFGNGTSPNVTGIYPIMAFQVTAQDTGTAALVFSKKLAYKASSIPVDSVKATDANYNVIPEPPTQVESIFKVEFRILP